MYSYTDILNNVKYLTCILTDDLINEVKQIIRLSEIKVNDVFKETNQYYIDLTTNVFMTGTIFPIIKNKFNYNGSLQEVVCKIQSHVDNEKYHTITETENSDIFCLNVNEYNGVNVDLNILLNIIKKKECIACKETGRVSVDITDAELELFSNRWNDIEFSISETDYINMIYAKDFFVEKQNMVDNMGYLYIVPSNKNENTGVAYEHLNNSCVRFPGNYFHKMKPHFRFSNNRRISLIFKCKGI